SKPVPVNVTTVPPDSGPDDGVIAESERPASCVTRTRFAPILSQAVRGDGSLLAFAENVTLPLPVPHGVDPYCSQLLVQSSKSARHFTYCCAVIVNVADPPRPGMVSSAGATSRCAAA